MASLRRSRLSVTPLEARDTPANLFYGGGNFFSNVGSVNLLVQFTGTNAITWSTAPPTTPAIFAAGTSIFGSNLSINLTGIGINTAGLKAGNTAIVDLQGNTLTGNLTINMSPGDDVVKVVNGTILGQVNINTNGGNDNVMIGGGSGTTSGPGTLTISKYLRINEGVGDDSIAFSSNLNVAGNCSINMGVGNNNYSLASQFKIGGNLQMVAGNGNDPILQLGVAGSSIGGNAAFMPGNGANLLSLPAGLTIGGNATYIGGTGADGVFDDATINGSLVALMGPGQDRFTYGFSPFVGVAANINGGPPLGDVYTQLSIPSRTNTVTNFP